MSNGLLFSKSHGAPGQMKEISLYFKGGNHGFTLWQDSEHLSTSDCNGSAHTVACSTDVSERIIAGD